MEDFPETGRVTRGFARAAGEWSDARARRGPSLLRCARWLATTLAGIALACAPSTPAPSPPRPPADRFADPQLAVDATGTTYVAAIERSGGDSRLFVATSSDHGETWSAVRPSAHDLPGTRRRPQLATGAPGQVYLLWEDSRSGPVDLWFNRSRDGGRTWLPQDLRINTNVPAASHLSSAVLACDDRDDVYVVWLDDREGFEALYVNRSRDAGESWLASDRRITALGFGRKAPPRLECDADGAVYVTWMELRDGRRRIYFNASTDYGETWALDDTPLSPGSAAVGAELCVLRSGVVFVCWLEESAGAGELAFVRSGDRGRSWQDPRRFSTRELPGLDVSLPRVLTDGDHQIYVASYAAAVDGPIGVVLESSADGGGSFQRTTVRTAYPIGALAFGARRPWYPPPFGMGADRAGNVYFTWVEQRQGVPGVGFDRVADYGRAWMHLSAGIEPSDHLPVSSAPPELAVDDFGHVCVLWNEGGWLHAAASPFNGDSGWRHSDL